MVTNQLGKAITISSSRYDYKTDDVHQLVKCQLQVVLGRYIWSEEEIMGSTTILAILSSGEEILVIDMANLNMTFSNLL